MTTSEFFMHYVEGYIFGDLESMASLGGHRYGGAGFPMILTCLSGMELLGNLLLKTEKEFNEKIGRTYFLNYWDNYFSELHKKYKGLGPLFYKLMRHGIAHNFLTKPGVYISKNGNWGAEVKVNTKEILIDCIVFYKEFKESYESMVIPILNSSQTDSMPNLSSIKKRTKSMQEVYILSRDNSFKDYEKFLKNQGDLDVYKSLLPNNLNKVNIPKSYYPLSDQGNINNSGVSDYTGAEPSGTNVFIS